MWYHVLAGLLAASIGSAALAGGGASAGAFLIMGGYKVKRLLSIIIAAAIFIPGCSEQETVVYTERCGVCGDDVPRFIRTVYEDYICASCFWEEGWQMCRGCDLAYSLDEFDCADGFCSNCAENESWSCSVCEERYGFDHLVDLENGYYLCATCAGPYILESAPDVPSEVAEFSPFIPYWPQGGQD